MHLVFWQNLISPHQAPFLRELATMGHDVLVVAPEEMDHERRQLGWETPDLGAAKVVVRPTDEEVARIIFDGPHDTIHIMAGARWLPLGKLATRICLKSRRRIGVLTEAPDPRGLAGVARRLKYLAEYWQRGRKYEFLLVMGEMGVRWFRGCGYGAEKASPFAYVTDSGDDSAPVMNDNPVTFLYVGQMIARKRVDLLINCYSKAGEMESRLWLLGSGVDECELRELASGREMARRINWHGAKKRDEIKSYMGLADVLVLPSDHDGWGAVVNEALMAGTPVICSDACGAAELIREEWLGTVFAKGSAEGLASALRQWTLKGKRTYIERQRIREWSRCIEGGSVARYFVEVMEHVYHGGPRPVAPWRVGVSDSSTES